MKKSIFLIITVLSIGILAWWFTMSSPAKKRERLINWMKTVTDSQEDKDSLVDIFEEMSDSEIRSTYRFIFFYVNKNKGNVPTKLRLEIEAISEKYGIFT